MLDSSPSFTSSSIVMVGHVNDSDDIESTFSMLSDATDDDLSVLSYYDDNSGDIELVSMKHACYTHSRNTQLNKNLDFAVIFSLAVVVGLGIGNFLGYSENCSQFVAPGFYPRYIETLARLDSVATSALKEELLFGVAKRRIPEPSCAVKGHSDDALNVSVLVIEQRDEEPERTDLTADPFPAVVVVRDNLTDHVPADTNLRIDLLDDAAVVDIEFAHVRKSFNAEFELASTSRQEETLEPFDFTTLLHILRDGSDDVVTKMRSMVQSLITVKQPSHGELKMVERMFDAFLLSIHGKIKELTDSMSRSLFDNKPMQKGKVFMKMSNVILKAVDKFLEINFSKMLINDERPVQSCLKSIHDSGFYVMRHLEEKWMSEKKRVMGYPSHERVPPDGCGKHGCRKAQRLEKGRDRNDKSNYANRGVKKHFEKKRF